MNKKLVINYESTSLETLDNADRNLVESAKDMCKYSYAPFSNFHVGCAVQLEDDTIVTGNNQENASFPCGTCAERTTIFYAHANYPQLSPKAIAIAARQKDGEFTARPLPPCGACRQALLEMENLFNKPLRLILYGTEETLVFSCVKDILPFHFDKDSMQ